MDAKDAVAALRAKRIKRLQAEFEKMTGTDQGIVCIAVREIKEHGRQMLEHLNALERISERGAVGDHATRQVYKVLDVMEKVDELLA